MTYLTFSAAAQRHQIQQQATLLARYYAGLQPRAAGAGAGHGVPPNATLFVMPPRANVQANLHRVPVPPQFAQQVMQVARQPIARSERHPQIAGKINGRPFEFEMAYEGSRHVHGSTPLPELMGTAQAVLNAWPPSAEGTVQARGSRQDHTHPEKAFEIKRRDDVLQIIARQRRNSDLQIYPNGDIYLGGRIVTEKSDPVVFRRVASRLNAAVNFLAACDRAVKTAPPNAAVQTDAPQIEHKEVQVKAPGVSVGTQAGQSHTAGNN